MSAREYDLVTVGGGLGGAAIARRMAEAGASVLVVERETRFRDRVRGEFIEPWGLAEAAQIGLDQILLASGHRIPFGDTYIGAGRVSHRDYTATSVHRLPSLGLFHPAMQEAVLDAAVNAGAQVRRGANVREVRLGSPPTVVIEDGGRIEDVRARLVAGADGRSSMLRKSAGFETRREPDRLQIAGLLLEGTRAPDDSCMLLFNPMLGQTAYLFPQGDGRTRAYVVYPVTADFRLTGDQQVRRFLDESLRAGAPAEFYQGTRPSGPLASFVSADHWVDHPYRDGLALVGDAAGASDPTWGQGLSLTLRDVRVLSDFLLSSDDWDAAGHAYAAAHDHHFGVIHEVDNWYRRLFLDQGPAADELRMRALPLIAQDATRMPDHLFSGPDLDCSDAARRRFFGEE